MEEQRSPTLMFTKEQFEEKAEVSVSSDTWQDILPVLTQVKAVGDPLWNLCVKMAQEKAQWIQEKAQLIQEKAQWIQKEAQLIQENTELRKSRRPMLVLSASEVSKREDLRNIFRDQQVAEEPCRGGFIAQKFYLDFVCAARQFSPLKGKERIVAEVAKLGETLSVRAEFSLFSDDFLDEEAPQSAVGSELFRLAIDLLRPDRKEEPVPILKVTHQQRIVNAIDDKAEQFEFLTTTTTTTKKRKTADGDASKKKSVDQVDICVWFIHPNEALGACVLAVCEYKPSATMETERKAQADMYGSNVTELHQKQCIVIDIAGGNRVDDWQISAYGLVEAKVSGKNQLWEKSPLYCGRGAEGIVMVAHGLLAAQKSFPDRLGDYGCRLGPVVGVVDDVVYKVYDGAKTRRPNLDAIQLLLDRQAELLSSNDKDEPLVIIKMAQKKSDWFNDVKSDVFKKIIEKLKQLHARFGPHGDIRLSNLLSCGEIVDFDFVGAESYPSTMNSISRDGERHPEVERMIATASGGGPVSLKPKAVHDWYSLGKVMHLFHPIDESKVEEWKKLCDKVKDSETGPEIHIPRYPIALRDKDLPLNGTGHIPVKKQLTKSGER